MAESSEQFARRNKSEMGSNIFSPSVLNVERNLRGSTEDPSAPVPSLAWVEILLKLHDEYAPKTFKNIYRSSEYSGIENIQMKSMDEWKEEVKNLIDPKQFEKEDFIIHGKLFILCLCELDPVLKAFMQEQKIYQEISENTTPDLEEMLSKELKNDKRMILDDSPEYRDYLGRNSFARAMCMWLDNNFDLRQKQMKIQKGDIYSDTKSFVLHIGGPWGSGKSTLLNLIEKGFLCKDIYKAKDLGEEPLRLNGDWITVWFSAWRNQQADPAWWPLMNRISRDSIQKLRKIYNKPFRSFRISLKERLWRIFAGKIWYFIAFLLSIAVLVAIYFIWQGEGNASLTDYETTIKAIASILGLLGTIWTGLLTFGNSLASGSVSSAKNFLQQGNDPLEKLKKHFSKFMHYFNDNNHPILVFIDDLDRCHPEFVVDLMEGIQTIFTHRNLFFIVAADRRWLHTSFEKQYENFKEDIMEPGKRLGYLFLEKAIQASVTVPRLEDNYKKRYLDYLYDYQEESFQEKIQAEKERFRQTINNISDDNELTGILGENKDDFATQQAIRELVIERSASQKVAEEAEYFLRDFTHLLEPNPRSVKRFINAYNIYKTLAYTIDDTLINSLEKRKQFALWTILSMRWPLLAEMLENDPYIVDDILCGTQTRKGTLECPLVRDKEVKEVVTGGDSGVSLDVVTIKKLCRINPIVHKVSGEGNG